LLELLAQQVLNGLSTGMGYVLVALGLTLMFGVLHIVNFSHGELYMLGGFVALVTVRLAELPYALSVLAAVAAVALVGWLIDAVAVRPVMAKREGRDTVMLSTYAVGLLLFDAVLVSWGTAPQRVPGFSGAISLFDLTLTVHRSAVLLTGTVLLLLTWFVLNRTRFGKQMRAVAENAFAAQVVGIPVRRIGTSTFVIAAALAGMAGALLVPVSLFTPHIGQNVIIKAFVVVVIGGMGSILGATACGLALGVLEAIGSIFIPAGFNLALIYTALLAVLLVRPHGLFARAS
jgi:branched-chain amino acid transport system permease protein